MRLLSSQILGHHCLLQLQSPLDGYVDRRIRGVSRNALYNCTILTYLRSEQYCMCFQFWRRYPAISGCASKPSSHKLSEFSVSFVDKLLIFCSSLINGIGKYYSANIFGRALGGRAKKSLCHIENVLIIAG